MNKVFEALKNIKIRCHPKSMWNDPIDSDLETIEQSLLKTEKLEKENDELKGQVKYLTEVVTDFQKILSIIREKNVDIGFLKWCLAEYDSDMAIFVYNGGQNILPENKLTQEEFDLLKEVLG